MKGGETMKVGKIIKKYRLQKNLTQKELAQKSGVAEITIRKMETEDSNPKLETLEKIAISLDIPITFFFPDDWKDIIDSNISKDNKIDCFVEYLASLNIYLFESNETNFSYLEYQNKEIRLNKEKRESLKKETDDFLRFKVEQLFRDAESNKK